MSFGIPPPSGTVRATLTAHGSGRAIRSSRLVLLASRQVGSVHVLSYTPNLYLPSPDFLPSVFPRLASVSTLSGQVLPYPAGYGFPVPFGCWPSLLKQSLPSYGCVPPLPLAYWLTPDRMRVITFRICEMRPTKASSISRRAWWCSRSWLDGPTSFGCSARRWTALLSSTS